MRAIAVFCTVAIVGCKTVSTESAGSSVKSDGEPLVENYPYTCWSGSTSFGLRLEGNKAALQSTDLGLEGVVLTLKGGTYAGEDAFGSLYWLKAPAGASGASPFEVKLKYHVVDAEDGGPDVYDAYKCGSGDQVTGSGA